MYCPSCGLEEIHSNQFCRACGIDLRPVRTALARPDSITDSAVSARREISSAISAKIRNISSSHELKKVAEDVLPEIEKFLESPEERRMRGIRKATVVTLIGFSATLAFSIVAALVDNGLAVMAAAGSVAMFIGIGLFINAYYFSAPRKSLPDRSTDAVSQRELDAGTTNELVMPTSEGREIPSVTEGTTRHLNRK